MSSVFISSAEARELVEFAKAPNGSKYIGDRLTVEAVDGGGLHIKVLPFAERRK